MARMPCSYIPPGTGGNNFTSSQATPFQYHGNGSSPAGFQPPNNFDHIQPLTSIVPQVSAVQQRGPLSSAVSSPFRSGFGTTIPPYMQHARWPPYFNCPAPIVAVYPMPDQTRQDVRSPEAIPHFNTTFPPPSPMDSARQWTQIQDDCHSNSMSRYADRVEDMDADQVWVKSWLQCRSKEALAPPSSNAKKLKPWKIKKSLQDCWTILGELEDLEKELTTSGKELGEIDWSRKVAEADLKKALFQKNLNEINENEMKNTKVILSKRRNKRARERNKRLLEREHSSIKYENRKKLHLELDMWLERQQAEVELLKQEESMKQEADAVLWGVRRKQSEGRKILSLLSTLVKLHHVRSKKKECSSNPVPSEDREQFTKIIDKLANLWEGQMKDYEAEEKTLRVMLQENPEEKKMAGKGPKNDLRHDLSKLERSNKEWEITLFGDCSQEMTDLALDLYRPFFLQPFKTLDALIENRGHWDQFISNSPSSSSIPIGWVMPKEASSKEWKEKTM